MNKLLKILWSSIRIIIYLLVAYSIIFTLTLSIGAYKAYDFFQTELATVTDFKTKNPQQTAFMKRVQFRLQKQDSIAQVTQQYVPIDSISLHLKNAVIAVEDAAFFQHPGIHIQSIIAALETNKRRGKKSHGGSTLTQQLAKNLYLSPEKTMQRKVRELVYTLLLEKYLGKDRILELYLNYAQWGKDIFGCEAAAMRYYKKSCKDISFNESVQLASILANPVKYKPGQRGSRLLAQRRRIIYENFYQTRKISLETFQKITGDQPRRIKEEAYRQEIQEIQKALPKDSVQSKASSENPSTSP